MQSKSRNPLEKDVRKKRKPYVHDQKKRNEILCQGFSKDKIPSDLDAIIVGSGIGGLTTAALLAKSGKRVLVLEQHDQAGGCCHSFIDKGYEFDVGIHYIGQLNSPTINRTLCDQITEGQLEWEPLNPDYDVVSIGFGEENRKYLVKTDLQEWKNYLKTEFPEERSGIEKYFELVLSCNKSTTLMGILKLTPLWLVKLVLWTGLLKRFTKLWSKVFLTKTMDVVNELTTNKDLQTIFTYCWGDYGTPPSRSNFNMQAMLNRHFSECGASYPIGGASEIAFSIIPVIEKTGGRVLVRANVTEITTRGDKVCGVKVEKGGDKIEILAPIIISSAGVYNTFQSLLPKELSSKSYFTDIARTLKPGVASMSIFIGLNVSNDEIESKKQNVWSFPVNNTDQAALDYFDLSAEEAMTAEVPLLFISFPSTKDPEWANHPGRSDKSTLALVTLANWEWFKDWKDKGVKKRGDAYKELKDCIGHQMVEHTLKLFPELRDKIDYVEIGSPVTNNHYLAAPHGEIYGLDHCSERFDPLMIAKLRPETDIPGLYLTGQDILSCGFTGALFSGILTAQACLGRNVMADLINLHKKINSDKKKVE
ncbi:putative all-trans-retinol 13,14-reductase isoform X2 [Eurytemora carolleeae]|nr:putative all-trans-retinol 13,14-reductase isoform X2 [Eurytemora carolleeae]|eukprot:XP_023348959.1 putative all-trans-retinol 13,14-reductase isoform X2 [Eurytemora affinis]